MATAELIQFDSRSKTPVAEAEYISALHAWIESRDISETLSPDEIGKLSAFARVDVQRKSLILHLSRYYQTHKTADVAPGVATVITLLSDNDKGVAKVSEPVLAAMFGRSVSAVHEARKRLKEASMISTSLGRYAGSYPIIPRAIANSYNHLAWLLEATKTFNHSASQGDCQSHGQTRGLNQSHGQTRGLAIVNHSADDDSITRPDAGLLLLDTSEEESPPIVPQTGDVSALNNETWGSTPWRVAAGVTVAVGMAFGATSDPAFAGTDLGPAYVQQNLFAADVERAAHINANDRMLTELATLTAGADGTPFRYNVPWSTVSTVHEAREAATEGGPLKKKKEKIAPGEYTHDFEEFWKIYPRREGKGLAFKSWQKLTIEYKRIAYVALKKQLPVLIDRANNPEKNYCPLPATWINQCRFDDDVGGDVAIRRPAYSNNGSYAGKTI